MSRTLPSLPPWPAGQPLPDGAITLFYDPATNQEYRVDLTRLGDTPAATELSLAQLQALLVAGDGVTITPTKEGKLLISSTVVAATPKAPAAPTAGQVDDTADTFSFLPNPAYPAAAQYKVVGRPGVTGAEQLDSTNSYVSGGRIYLKVVGAVSKGGLAVYVAGSGSVPDGAALTNADPFTGAVVTPGDTLAPNISLTVPTAGATLTLGQPVQLTANATDNVGVTGVVFTNGATGAVLGTGTKNGNTYSVAYTPTTAGALTITATASDAAGNSQAASVSVNVQAATNQPPSVTINGSSSATAGTSQNYQSVASDSDGVVALVELLLMGDANTLTSYSVIGSDDSSPYVVGWTPASAGTAYLRMRATDDKGAQSFSSVLSVSVQAAGGGGQPVTYTPQASDYRYTSYAKPGNGGTIYNPFWEINFTTASDTLVLSEINEMSAYNDQGNPTFFSDISGVGVWVNGSKLGDYPVPTNSRASEYTTPAINLPGTSGSTRTVKVRSGYVQGGVDYTAAMKGGILTKLTTVGGLTVVPFTRKANVFFGVGDSIMSGFKGVPSVSNSYLMLSRDNPALSNWDILAHSWGSNAALNSFSDSNRSSIVQAAYAATRGYSGRKAVFIALGTNDMLASYDAGQVATFIGKFCDELHTLDTTIEVHLSTPIRALTSVISSDRQSAYASAYNNLATNRPWLALHNGQNAVQDSDYDAGDVHPINIGNVHFAAWLKSEVFDKVPTGGPVYGGLVPLAFEGSNIDYDFVQGSDGNQWYEELKKNPAGSPGYFYGAQAIGASSASGLLGKLVMYGGSSLASLAGLTLGLSSFKPTTAGGVEFGIAFTSTQAQAKYRGVALGSAFVYPANTGLVGSEIQVYADKIVYAIATAVSGGATSLQVIYTQSVTATYPLIPAAFLANADTRVRFQALTNVVNKVDTPTGALPDPNPTPAPDEPIVNGIANNDVLVGSGRYNNWHKQDPDSVFDTVRYQGGVQTVAYNQAWTGNALRIHYLQSPGEASQDVYVDGVYVGGFNCDGPQTNGKLTPQVFTTNLLSGTSHNQFEFRYTRGDGGGQCYIDYIEFITVPTTTPTPTITVNKVVEDGELSGSGRYNNWHQTAAAGYSNGTYSNGGVQTVTYPSAWTGNALRIYYLQSPGEAIQDVYVDGVKVGSFSCDGPQTNGALTPLVYVTDKLSGSSHSQFEFRYTRGDGGGQCYIDKVECITIS